MDIVVMIKTDICWRSISRN